MSATTFDTLTYAKKLREAGFTEQQAEAQAEALKAVVDDNLATKRDIELVRSDPKESELRRNHEIALVRSDLKELEARITHEMKHMESRITIRLGGMIVAAVVVLAVLIRVL